jgi:hypothetical protein
MGAVETEGATWNPLLLELAKELFTIMDRLDPGELGEWEYLTEAERYFYCHSTHAFLVRLLHRVSDIDEISRCI